MATLTETKHEPSETAVQGTETRRAHLLHAVHHTAHMLSEQGPMNITFVHNNTLLGLQKQHFHEAITTAHNTLGLSGYEPDAHFLKAFDEGRITDADLDESLAMQASADQFKIKIDVAGRVITVGEIVKAVLRSDAGPRRALAALTEEFNPECGFYALGAERNKQLPRLAKSGSTNFKKSFDAVGKALTLGEWLGQHFNVPVAKIVMRTLAEHQIIAGPSTEKAALDGMGIPFELRESYRERAKAVWGKDAVAALAVEQRIVAKLAEQMLFCEGRYAAIRAKFQIIPEGYEVRALHSAVYRALGLVDPLFPLVQDTLAERPNRLPKVILRERPLDASETADLNHLVQALRSHDSSADTSIIEACIAASSLPDSSLGALRQLAEDVTDAGLRGRIRLLAGIDSETAFSQELASVAAALAGSFSAGKTIGEVVTELTGLDVIQKLNNAMIGHLAAFTDEGLAALRMPHRQDGLFGAWRAAARSDALLLMEGGDGWRDRLAGLSEDPSEALIQMLDEMGVPEDDWEVYLGRALVQLKGWAGMMFWMETHGKHAKQSVQAADTIQYLAMRIFTERELAKRVLGEIVATDANYKELADWSKGNEPEVYVRLALHGGVLDGDLIEDASIVLSMRPPNRSDKADLLRLSRLQWQNGARLEVLRKAAQDGLRVMRVAAQLGLSADDVDQSPGIASEILDVIDSMTEANRGRIWLEAFEVHYRDEVLNALSQNKGKGRWIEGRKKRPKSQVVFCIDEREENLHRYYAELDPEHETLGAAGFFGIAIAHSPLGGHDTTPLCPAVATPAHCIAEVPREIALETVWPVAKRRSAFGEAFKTVMWEAGRNPVMAFVTTQVTGLFHAVPLIGRVFAPLGFERLSKSWVAKAVPPVPTRLTHQRLDEAATARYGLHASTLPFGFTVAEAADRIEAQLRNWGLTYQFARIVVICAHRSFSVNNPHENAHDCGACGGKAGGPNARLFAALANENDVRSELRVRGIDIPSDTWFVGAEHNTCNDEILTFDTEDIPSALAADWAIVSGDLEETSARAARERCRRFRSAPKDASPKTSWAHVQGRSQDLSQVRPEWGHATNAFAVVGRRALTQGLFFDRRGFVISYDPTQDADGKILERILMAVGPVGAGINLEYYFSTVNPDGYGSGTKVPHNVVGMIGVMPGAKGDLATGLPRQMTEVHEAMRLQLIVDAPLHILGEIYGRQPAIQELLNGQWVHLIAHDPATCNFHRFVPGVGFVQWDKPLTPLPEVKESYEWIRGKHDCFLPPARVHEPTSRWADQPNGGKH